MGMFVPRPLEGTSFPAQTTDKHHADESSISLFDCVTPPKSCTPIPHRLCERRLGEKLRSEDWTLRLFSRSPAAVG